ncbi:type II CAAX endopeptidase family protein [Microbacterium sp. STN6]|uniref:CPBP family intramembrane glutamic endopeptidase n=1 Tax=Microbacterium sp. STN6 TaxID=2995588 RepID=UPI002260F8B1|nr:type II CAAX endopeptidase family protein [Microbacterium sp. STN6]MCX7522623.1 type II CAAX endopeptidase family protein [Microbacterium sp. STN6]
MKRHPLLVFFVLAFLLPWLVWGTTIAENAGMLSWHIPQSLAFWLGLTIATYTAAALTGGWPAVKDLLLRLIRVRVAVWWYAAALLLTPVLALVAGSLGALVGQPALAGVALPVSGLAGALLLNIWMWLITEETAWRGYALPRLQRRMNPLVASLVLGVAWGVWHLPLFFIADTFQAGIPFAGFLLSTIATSVIIGWIFNHAHGSVLIAALFHGVTDVAIAFSGAMSSGMLLFWVFVAVQVLAAAAVAPDLARMPRDIGQRADAAPLLTAQPG